MADWDQIGELMRSVAESGDDGDQWQALATAIEPELSRFAKRQPIGRLREKEDSAREILTRVLARLRAGDFASLKAFAANDPAPHPRAWLRVLVRRSAIDYMREQPEFVRSDRRWVSLVSYVTNAGGLDPDTLAQKRREVVQFMEAAVAEVEEKTAELGDEALGQLALQWQVARLHVRRLAKKGPLLLRVLSGTLDGHSQVELAKKLEISRRDVQLAIRAIEEFLEARGFGA